MFTTFAHAGHDHTENHDTTAPEVTHTTTTAATNTSHTTEETDFSMMPFIIGGVTLVVITFAIFILLFRRPKRQLKK